MTIINTYIFEHTDNKNGFTLTASDDLVVNAKAGIYTEGANSSAVYSFGNGDVTIKGTLYSDKLYGFDSSVAGQDITVTNSGSISGGAGGIHLTGGFNKIVNTGGSIDGEAGASVFSQGGNSSLTNSGELLSGTQAVFLNGLDNVFTNSGTVEGGSNAYAVLIGGTVSNSGDILGGGGVALIGTEAGVLVNSGEIDATQINHLAISGTFLGDKITNTGLVWSKGPVAIGLGGGNDVYNGQGTGHVIGEIQGSIGDDTLYGGNYADTFRGEQDNDTLSGGGGVDTLDGGAGNDQYLLGSEATGVDTLIDASGVDTVFSTITRSIATWDFIENLVLQGAANINGTGNDGNNLLVGNSGKNTLEGGKGRDILSGGAGADILKGGEHNDTYNLGADFDTVIDTSGFDTITTTISRSLAGHAAIENLRLEGSANLSGTGNGLSNELVGNMGNNSLKGGDDGDTLEGGLGQDSLYGEAGNDVFRFTQSNHSAVGASRDIIYDFDDNTNDIIDLMLMPGVSSFIGTADFSAAGQVRVQQVGANVLVQINVSGTSGAESEILLAQTTIGSGMGQVDFADFLLN